MKNKDEKWRIQIKNEEYNVESRIEIKNEEYR